ncbi:three-Cys-motif partner protein TcmP [Helicobacter sp. MIT 05-5294]|uniref:three-Cys-motif partner protein TcmP n=1 Tax=Helicobacter sp. MIT 05-5294 TaxID=1548150 RepID=UPI00051F9741|nr:three-Cys-motif partner protein TcmP [Helicobacter sp. MIT 05-5294]TLD86572.1 three-Cys-motif partner protein TcmP [Helicobacter sp. MIT 05-5294]
MAKDMHTEEWESATLTKLAVFEQYIHDWLNVTLNYQRGLKFNTLEIYDLFCGSGYDGVKIHKGSPLRILDAVLKRNRKEKTIKIYLNDNDKNKIERLKQIIQQEYPNLEEQNIKLQYTSINTKDYKIHSGNYYKLIFLDQYGIQHVNKIEEFLMKGTDLLVFISSGHVRRFVEDEGFKKYIDSRFISKQDFEGKSNYETHRVITQYFKQKFSQSFISPFSLVKDNGNINGLIFISSHQKGQEQFLKTAWKIDGDFGEGNKNIDRDITKEKGTLFYDKDAVSEKEKRYKELLVDYLKECRSNIDIKTFGLDNGFLAKHTNVILQDIKNNLQLQYYNNAKSGFHLDDDKLKVKVRYIK